MARQTKEKLFYKKEAKRTKTEKLVRDVACYGVVIYAAILGFLLIDANANLANAESDFASTTTVTMQNLN
jgi:hypothetical protein